MSDHLTVTEEVDGTRVFVAHDELGQRVVDAVQRLSACVDAYQVHPDLHHRRAIKQCEDALSIAVAALEPN